MFDKLSAVPGEHLRGKKIAERIVRSRYTPEV